MQLIATDNRTVVVGLGMTGLSVARYLASRQRPFAVVDSREEPPGLDQFRSEFPGVLLTLGAISDEALQGAATLVVSPGVGLDEPAISRAIAAGAKVCGDIDLFREEVSAPIVAITGSNGKSTVTTLVGEMARHCGRRVAVAGNIGLPVLDLLRQNEQPELYVLELSSFQLERCENLRAEVATVLNLSADHMDRYSGMVAYHQAKHRIFRGCKQAVINRGDNLSNPLVSDQVALWSFGLDKPDFHGFGLIEKEGVEYLAYQFEPLLPVSSLKIAGRHNIENALAALALGMAVGLPLVGMVEALEQFAGLPHRCQFVAERDGVRFYNDSKGTNVGATIAAIQGLAGQGPVDQELNGKTASIVLIAGGIGKGADFAPLAPVMKKYCKAVVLIGESAGAIGAQCDQSITTRRADSMDEAVALAAELAESGDQVLLSPACASFDMFENYQHRGDQFAAAVHELAGGVC